MPSKSEKKQNMEFFSKTSTSSDIEVIVPDLVDSLEDSFDLGILFVSATSKVSIQELVLKIKERADIKCLLGCTCAGIIGNDVEIEQKPATTLILAKLPDVQLKPFSMTQAQLEELNSPEQWYKFCGVHPEDNPKFLTLPDPFLFDMNQFLEDVNIVYPNCPVIGGLASGAMRPRENALVLNEQQFKEGIVGVILTGEFDIKTIVSQGCRPIGETYIVTKAEQNVIHELAGQPLLSVLKTVLDAATTRDKLLAQEALFVGIAMNEYTHKFKRGDFLIRALIGIDENTGAGAIADYIETGQTVQFHVRDAQTATEDLNELLSEQQKVQDYQKPKGVLVFSCNGRGFNLFKQKNHDIKIIQKHIGPIPAAGFFCAGEVGPVGGSNFLHGFTSSIALFYQEQELPKT